MTDVALLQDVVLQADSYQPTLYQSHQEDNCVAQHVITNTATSVTYWNNPVSVALMYISNDGYSNWCLLKQHRSRPSRARQQAMPSWEEQKLCIGASFMVAARNDHDPTRRINIAGFCQSVDLLFESVEDIVMLRGGEILDEERQLKSGLHEALKLTVTLPYLWGVPPTLDCLRSAIEVGGGIIDRVYHRWDIY